MSAMEYSGQVSSLFRSHNTLFTCQLPTKRTCAIRGANYELHRHDTPMQLPHAGQPASLAWEVPHAATFAAKEREDLMKGYLQILREITGVRTSTPTAILLAELGLQALSDEWLLRAAKFWNNLAALPPDNIHRCMALDSCKSAIGPRNRRKNWAGSMYRAIIDTGYQRAIRLDDMDAIDITALRHFITQRRDAVWEGLDVCPRTCPSVGARLCTYAAWFARPPHKHARSLLDLPLSSRCMQTLFRFRMGVHRLPKDEGSWNRVPST